jgi:predicted O-methyltransferase YrrM
MLKSAWRLSKLVARDPRLITTAVPYARDPHGDTWGQPWWNPDAIRYAGRLIRTGSRAFEWGSGSSTVWLTRRGVQVTAIESEPEWADRVKQSCPTADIRTIPGEDVGTMRSEPALRDHGEHYFDKYVTAIDEFSDATFDLIIIDGICRRECAERAVAKVKRGGIVVLDDTQWPEIMNPCFEPFSGWRTVRRRGFKKRSPIEVYETTFLTKPS